MYESMNKWGDECVHVYRNMRIGYVSVWEGVCEYVKRYG